MRGRSTACTKNVQQLLFGSFACPSLWNPSPARSLSDIHPQKESLCLFKFAGFLFNSCTVLPTPFPRFPSFNSPEDSCLTPNATPGPVHGCSTHYQHPFILEYIRERRELKIAFALTAHKIKLQCQLWRCKNEDCICAQSTELLGFHVHPSTPSQSPLLWGRGAGERLERLKVHIFHIPPVFPVGEGRSGVGGVEMHYLQKTVR